MLSIVLFYVHTVHSLSTRQGSNNSTSSSCLCRRRPISDLETAFKLANQPGCIHLETMEAGKIPCTQKGRRNATALSGTATNKLNSTSVPFHIVSWDTRCLASLKLSSECFGRGKRECTWSEEIKKLNVGSGVQEIFPAFELQVNCKGCNESSCLTTNGSCHYQQNLVRYLPLVKSGRCAADGYDEWVAAKTFRLVNAACSCIYRG